MSGCDCVILLLTGRVVEGDAHRFVDRLPRLLVYHAENDRLSVVLDTDSLLLCHRRQLVVHEQVRHARLAHVWIADDDGLEGLPIGDTRQLGARILRRTFSCDKCSSHTVILKLSGLEAVNIEVVKVWLATD